MSDRREKKIARKAVEAKKLKEQQMLNHPEWCYCEEILYKEAEIDLENDKPIGKTEPVDGFPYWNSKGYTQDIYRCKRCGKQYCIPIIYAPPNVAPDKLEIVGNDEEVKRKLIGKIIEGMNAIHTHGRYAKANYVVVPVNYIERVAIELSIDTEEASNRIAEYFAQHIN